MYELDPELIPLASDTLEPPNLAPAASRLAADAGKTILFVAGTIICNIYGNARLRSISFRIASFALREISERADCRMREEFT
jgi:hypothetical protein